MRPFDPFFKNPHLATIAGNFWKRPDPSTIAPSREEIWIYGYHPAAAALANPQRKILRIVATPESAARLREESARIAEDYRRLKLPVQD